MKIKSVTIKNFRGYKDLTTINFNDLTVFVGRNDIGKSTILDALDIFFNDGKGVNKIDKTDINKQCEADGDKETIISVTFIDLPAIIRIDTTNDTTLADEYLLNANGELEIEKRYSNAGAAKTFIKAYHPQNPDCADLLTKKIADLKAIMNNVGASCEDNRVSAQIRNAIWGHFINDLQKTEIYLDISSKDGDLKEIWAKLSLILPLYTLFQSDRKNSDGDNEVQDPLMIAVKEILADETIKAQFEDVAEKVKAHLNEVAQRTLEKVKEMNPNIANSLNPLIPDSNSLKWSDVFKKVSITGDNNIPLNKRGSGVKRLILLNFFRAEAERKILNRNSSSIIYAIEEPETSQHKDHQIKLIEALQELSNMNNTQVLLTTHSSDIVKRLQFNDVRLVKEDVMHNKTIETVVANTLPYPSLNEVNFIAFGDASEEYHNELYGYIDSCGDIGDFKQGKKILQYTKLETNGTTSIKNFVWTEIVRHQIHHPENKLNQRFSPEGLRESIDLMRSYIMSKK